MPLIDPSRADFDVDAFFKGQSAMAEVARDFVISTVEKGSYRLTLSHILELHQVGYSYFDRNAGFFRKNDVSIDNSNLKPPSEDRIIPLLEDMCAYLNDNFEVLPTINLAAFAMWRFLWIHPFNEGNGSVARLLSASILDIKYGNDVSRTRALFDFISANRHLYYEALADADRQWSGGELVVDRLEALIANVLDNQAKSADRTG